MMSVAGVGAAQAINMIERAHQMYRDGQHEEALDLYTEALSMAKSKPQKIALHSNRAACYLKLQDFKKAAEECTLVLELDHKHTGALMLRAQTLVTLKEYNSALFDVNRLMELNPSSDVYQSLQARLKTQLSLAPIPECDEEYFVSELEDDYDDERVEEIPAIAGTVKKAEGARSIPNPEDPASQTESFKDVANTHSEESEAILTVKLHTNPVVFADEKVEATRLSSADACAFSQTERFKDLAVVHYKGREISQAQSISAQKTEIAGTIPNPEAPVYQKQKLHISSTVHSKGSEATTQKQIMHSKLMADHKAKLTGTVANAASEKQQSLKDLPDIQSKAWEAIPKPKGHSNLDYSRWNRVEDDSSDDEEDEEEESLPQYRFRVKTVGVRPVK